MSYTKTTTLALLLLLAALAPGAARAQDVVAITNATVLDGAGHELKDATIVIRGGKIEEIGPAAKVQKPYDAAVIDAKGKVVFPGMVLAHTSGGMDRSNESVPVGPFLNVVDSIDPSQLFFEEALRDGTTTLHVIHGDDCVVGGLSRVVHPLGLTVGEMTLRGELALKLCVEGKRGLDRVRQRAMLRETFAELEDYADGVAEKRYEEEEKQAKREVKVPPAEARKLGMKLVRDEDLDDKHRNLWLLTQGRLDAFVTVPRAQDARFAVQLAREHGFLARTTFVVGPECFKAAGVFKAAGRPVVLDEELVHRERDAVSGEEHETFVPAVWAKAGVPFALQVSSGRRDLGDRWLWYQAARCVRGGVDRATALSAITRVPAKILGLEKRVGDVAKGLEADLLILSGDPLEMTTHVEQVLIGGRVVYERARDYRLRKLITGSAEEGDGKSAKADDKKDGKQDDGKQADDKKADDKKDDEKKDEPKQDEPKKDGQQ
ncbi:MAG: amidohydrolase family protein [Planctomycetota bacterium]